MNREDIIRMAREAGIDWHKHWDDEENRLERFAALVAAAAKAEENEACAKVCEPLLERPCGYQGAWEGYGKFKTQMTGQECAAAIRARKD